MSRTFDSRKRSDVSDDEHQTGRSHPVPRLRVSGRIQRPFGVRSMALTRLVYPGSLLRRLLHALNFAADRIGDLALSLYHHSD